MGCQPEFIRKHVLEFNGASFRSGTSEVMRHILRQVPGSWKDIIIRHYTAHVMSSVVTSPTKGTETLRFN
jgi:hypothetical protein